jgi:AbrB family looped-hinge helix DNA binding protein
MASGTGTVSKKGRITVPKDVRDALGIHPGDRPLFDVEGGDRDLPVPVGAKPGRSRTIGRVATTTVPTVPTPAWVGEPSRTGTARGALLGSKFTRHIYIIE